MKSLPQLLDIYYKSAGRNAALLLNLPVDRRDLVHEKDVEQLMKLRKRLDEVFDANLAENIQAAGTNVRNSAARYNASQAVDQNENTYWTTDKGVTEASLILEFKEPITFIQFLVQEYIK